MPSRPPPLLPDLPTPSPSLHRPASHRRSHLLPPLLAASISFAFFVLFAVFYRKLSRKRTVPADLKLPQKFSYSLLRRATASFSPSNRLGQGGFGSVYRGTLPSRQEIAVKLMDASGSLQGEREFQNELTLASRIDTACCPHVISVLGFSSDHGRPHRLRRRLLVYEYMHNGSLQEALLDRKCPELMDWKCRFRVILSIAKGIEYLHSVCDPPIVHGDVKPSNVLLDRDFNAKLADFGLAQVLSRDDAVEIFYECCEDLDENGKGETGPDIGGRNGDENASMIEEVASVMTEEMLVNSTHSPGSSCFRVLDGETAASPSPEMGALTASPREGLEKSSVSEGYFDRASLDSGNRRVNGRKKSPGRDWWWKQDNGNGGSESGSVKDYVMNWIGNEIKKERPKKNWIAASADEGGRVAQKKLKKKLEWWASLEEDRNEKERKHRKPREWWKEEFCEELTKKKKKKKRALKSDSGSEQWWQKDEDLVPERKRRKSRGSRGSIDWWLESFSGEFRNGRRNSQEFATGDIPKSGGISSTPSMRGTVCYIAPECGGGGQLSEKCDIYSFGVLLLVVVSGRRPLQMMASPMSEFERANLVSWARQLSHSGRLFDLVDANIQSMNREQVLLCITIALLCLQRSPGKRPTMKEIVEMLSGEAEPPHLPFEFSPSPPSNFSFKTQKQAR